MPKRRFTPQLIWVIPIVAVLVGGWLAAKAILERGPVITITFKTAEGLEAGKTKIKYKDVEIGVVKTIALSPDRKGIVVKAELSKQSEEFLREDTLFFVVRPRVTAGGVSGLSTLLSGGYIGMNHPPAARRQCPANNLSEHWSARTPVAAHDNRPRPECSCQRHHIPGSHQRRQAFADNPPQPGNADDRLAHASASTR